MSEPVYLSANEITAAARRAALADEYGPLVIATSPVDPNVLGAEPCVVLGVDVLPIDQANERNNTAVRAITETVERTPTASIAAALLIRSTTTMSTVDARLVLESATYSTLQSGPEFQRWRASRPVKHAAARDPETSVLFERTGDHLTVTLNRPTRGNAVDRSLRDGLTEAAMLALADDAIASITLSGNGPHFCTGGDLDEFGSFASPAEAHVVRVQRSPARFLARLGDRLTVRMHGNCAGSGVELAAFARHVIAHPQTTFTLPEIALGLVPGAGGTVSIVDRIGPQRTLQLLLTGERIDTPTALAWGLIDAIDDPSG